MSQITITLPDGSTKPIDAGAPVLAVAQSISPRLAEAALAAKVDDRLVDLSYPLTADARVQIVTSKSPEALRSVSALDGAPDGGRGHLALSQRAVRHRPADRRRLLLRLRRRAPVRARGSRAHRSEDARAGRRRISPYERQMWPRAGGDRLLHAARRAAEGAVDRGEDGRAVARLLLHDQGPRHVRGLLRRSARAVHAIGSRRSSCCTTSNAYWKGDAKNAPMQRIYGTAFFSQKELDEHLKRLEEAKKRDHRRVGKELGLFTFHPWAPGATFWLPKGHGALQHARQLHARRADPGGLRRGQGADHLQQGAVGDVRPLGLLPATTCSW